MSVMAVGDTESDITETEVRNGTWRLTVVLSTIFFVSCVDDHDERRQQETPDEILKNVILKLGEVVSPRAYPKSVILHEAHLDQDPIEELSRIEQQIRDHVPRNIPNVSEAFRLGYAELLNPQSLIY